MCALEICNALAHPTWNEGLSNFAENVAMRVCSRGVLFMFMDAVQCILKLASLEKIECVSKERTCRERPFKKGKRTTKSLLSSA